MNRTVLSRNRNATDGAFAANQPQLDEWCLASLGEDGPKKRDGLGLLTRFKRFSRSSAAPVNVGSERRR